jgi:S-adenosylmethionine:tRNA ribosyltransferase-isomerase
MVDLPRLRRKGKLFKGANTSRWWSGVFRLPVALEANEPPEARGLTRDQVRMMVSHYATDKIVHATFGDIGRYLHDGDVLVINTSGTMRAAIPARRTDGTPLELHLSTHLPADLWSVELRIGGDTTTRPFYDAQPGEVLSLSGGGSATLLTPHESSQRQSGQIRLWLATLQTPSDFETYLESNGVPIRYGYVKERWPIAYYQNVFATEMGSAEMPSAGRPFTPEIITRLVAKGVQIAPVLLHTGVASLEKHEPPYEEFYRVSSTTANLVNTARSAGKRVMAVGTTSVRALETVTDESGTTHPGEGWTNLVITAQRGIRAVDGLLTGFHEPRASHLAMLESLAGLSHLSMAYDEALAKEYLWHEFGDLHLILP